MQWAWRSPSKTRAVGVTRQAPVPTGTVTERSGSSPVFSQSKGQETPPGRGVLKDKSHLKE